MADHLKNANEKKSKKAKLSFDYKTVSKSDYKKSLYDLQVELVKLQRHVITENKRVLIIVEGRDSAGKDGLIKAMTEHMAPRETRIVALGKPTDRDQSSWYFQRYVAHLPAGGEIVIFNRSWYNRAGVERVMGFCSDFEHERFMRTVNHFEEMQVQSGLTLVKYYLDIDFETQKQRLSDRLNNPLKQWKISSIDRVALDHWTDYTYARNEMLRRTSHEDAPWHIVRADHKKTARINAIKDLLGQVNYPERSSKLCSPDRSVVFTYSSEVMREGPIAT